MAEMGAQKACSSSSFYPMVSAPCMENFAVQSQDLFYPYLSSLPLYIVHYAPSRLLTNDYGTEVLARLTEFNGCLSASFALSESEVANLQSKYLEYI